MSESSSTFKKPQRKTGLSYEVEILKKKIWEHAPKNPGKLTVRSKKEQVLKFNMATVTGYIQLNIVSM